MTAKYKRVLLKLSVKALLVAVFTTSECSKALP